MKKYVLSLCLILSIAARAVAQEAPFPYATYQEMRAQIGKLYVEKKYREAADILTIALDRFPDNYEANTFNLALMLTHLGETGKAVRALSAAHGKGIFFNKYLLEMEQFEPLKKDPAFAKFSAANEKMRAAAQAKAKPGMEVVAPEGYNPGKRYPLFVALHGGGGNIAVFKPQWTSEKLRSEFIVAYLQSSQVISMDGFGWTEDYEVARREITAAIHSIVEKWSVDEGAIIIGGFSSGGAGAMDYILYGSVPIAGFIALCPPAIDIPTPAKVAAVESRGVRGVLITTEMDARVDEQRNLVSALVRGGVPIPFIVVPNEGHWFPRDFAARLDAAIDEVRGRDPGGVDMLLLMSMHWGMNYYLNRDRFELAGWRVTRAGMLDTLPCCPYYARRGVPAMVPDLRVEDVEGVGSYDALAIMPATKNFGSDPFQDVIASPAAMRLVKEAAGRGIALSTICSGARVLAAADLLRGKSIVAEPSFAAEYEAAGATLLGNDHPPSIEGSIVTGTRDMYYSVANCEAIARVVERAGERGDHPAPPPGGGVFAAVADLPRSDAAWGRTLGGRASDGARSVCEAGDGSLLVAGYTFSHGTGDADMLVARFDSVGGLVWSAAIGGAGTEYANACAPAGGGAVVAGYTTSYGAGARDASVSRLDSAGSVLWTRTYGGPGDDVATGLCAAPDGGWYVCGHTTSRGAGEEDLSLIRLDRDGREIWSKTFGGARSEMASGVFSTPDGGCLVTGTTGTYGKGNCDFYAVRVDPAGAALWEQSYGTAGPSGHGFDWCAAAASAAEGGFILAGHTDCRDLLDVNALSIDSGGGKRWQTQAGSAPFYDYGNAVCAAPGGGCIVCGTAKSMPNENDILIARFGPAGDLAWQRSLGGKGSDWASAACLARNGDLVLAGYTNSSGLGSFDALVVRIPRAKVQ